MPFHLPVLPPELAGPAAGWAPKESFSPSQLAKFGGEDGCERAWAWGNCFGVWSIKKSIANLLGSLIHGSLEHYMRGGTCYDLNGPNGEIRLDARMWKEFQVQLDRGFITKERLAELAQQAPARAIAGLPHIPAPNDRNYELINAETWLDIDTTLIVGGVAPLKISGKLDLSARRLGVWYLYDHKSTKGRKETGQPFNPWAYVKTPEQLVKDPQAILYAADLILRHNLDGLWCRWVYYLTEPKASPLARPVDVYLTRQQVLEGAYHWLLIANRMRDYIRAARAGTLTPNDLPPNLAACPAYGGCSYHYSKGGPCMPEGAADIGALITAGHAPGKAKDMSLASAFQDANGAVAAAGAGQPPLVPAGNPLVPPEAGQAPTPPLPAALPAGWHWHNQAPRQDAPPGWQYGASGALEPAAPPAPASPPPPPPPPPVATSPLVPPPVGTPPAAPVPPAVAPQAAPAVPQGEAPKGRKGRPPGAKNKPKDGEEGSTYDVLFEAAVASSELSPLRDLTVGQLVAIAAALDAA